MNSRKEPATSAYFCVPHQRATYIGRDAVRAAIRRLPDRKGVRGYRCDFSENGWHHGHLPTPVVKGDTTAGEFSPHSGPRINKGPNQQGTTAYRATTPLVLAAKTVHRLAELTGLPIIWVWTTRKAQHDTAWFTTANDLHGTYDWNTGQWSFYPADQDRCNQSCDILFAHGATPEQATARADELRRDPDRGWYSRPRWNTSGRPRE